MMSTMLFCSFLLIHVAIWRLPAKCKIHYATLMILDVLSSSKSQCCRRHDKDQDDTRLQRLYMICPVIKSKINGTADTLVLLPKVFRSTLT